MNQYLIFAIAAITLALCGSGYLLKNQIKANGELSSQVVQRDQAIKRQKDQIAQIEADRKRLDEVMVQLSAERDAIEAKRATGSLIVRVESSKPTDFGGCSSVNVPADIVNRLRKPATTDRNNPAAAPANPSAANKHKANP